MLEKLVAASGDDFVKGYVRYRKIHPCKGYKEIRNKAAKTLSKVKGGRETDENTIVAVVGFQGYLLLIPIIFCIFLSVMFGRGTKAKNFQNRIQHAEYETIETLPEETVGKYENNYIKVPGLTDITVTKESPVLPVYNPSGNKCVMVYESYIAGKKVAFSDRLKPGENSEIDLYNEIGSVGRYLLEVHCKSFGLENNEKYNSVVQKIYVNVR